MPELPEVESVARSLRPRLVGRRVVSVETSGLALRRPIDRARLRRACAGATVSSVRRIGKYLRIELSSGWTLVAHLGMTGQLVFKPTDEQAERHTHAWFHLDGGLDLRYVDARRFGVLAIYRADEAAASPELSVLGVDPLDDAFTVDHLHQALAESRRDLKSFLLDQTRIAGLGNIYASEAMFLAGISPRRRTHRLGRERAARLHAAIRQVLESSIANRGTSFSDYIDAEGAIGSNQEALLVYGREGLPCRRCKSSIKRIVQAARSTFFCVSCQR
jgi:formamidopyrimidine-DNA glycosylase